jgi:hypothetical protein
LFVIPVVSALYFATPLDIGWLLGSPEKHHGYLFYIGIILFSVLLMASPREHLWRYISWSIYAALIVAVIAIGEHIGGIWDIYHRSEMLGAYPERSVSTLGNPNYVAGYLLIFFPLLAQLRSPERWIVMGLFTIAIVTTGSYIGAALLGFYFLYSWLRQIRISPRSIYISICLLVIASVYIGGHMLDSDKILSLMSRFVLMWESIRIMLWNPISFLMGFGPDSLIEHFAHDRAIIIDSYFPSNMNIDSSHNIFIDILFQYGIVSLGVILYSGWSHLKKQKEELQSAVLLGGIFLSLNVFVIVHILILILLIHMRSD